ncbi:hypothetical protein ScPMuIL_014893 [Solemya velum]
MFPKTCLHTFGSLSPVHTKMGPHTETQEFESTVYEQPFKKPVEKHTGNRQITALPDTQRTFVFQWTVYPGTTGADAGLFTAVDDHGMGMTRSNQRRRRREKVRFLQTRYKDGRELEIPEYYLHNCIIDPDSLPVCRGTEALRPLPDPGVHEFPESYWPKPDTILVPPDWSASDVWESCKKPRSNRLATKAALCQSNSCNSATNSTCSPDVRRVVLTEKMKRCLMRLDGVVPEDVELLLQVARYDFTPSEFETIKNKVPQRRNLYIKMVKQTFDDRCLGPAPDCTDPVHLVRELKRRTYTEQQMPYNYEQDTDSHVLSKCRYCAGGGIGN